MRLRRWPDCPADDVGYGHKYYGTEDQHGGLAVITAPIASADSTDDGYLQALKDKGITWPSGSDPTMVQIGHAVCTDSGGMTFDQTFADAKSGLPQLQDVSIARIMGAATGAYCPQYTSKFD
ncbi:MAG: DUF732 domain-containing protein [Mycobacterium sp.]|uniref:DUF732 domain-containing protein n=1 Tax=Mycobacterium sp. TaxID=1785 RepID=UPI003F9C2CB9